MPLKTTQLDTAAVLAGQATLLAGGLARAGDLAAFHALAAVLPAFCHAGFECPLGDDEPGLDFLDCLRRLPESRYLDAWPRLRRFGSLWREGADGLDRIPNCWLEFDLRGRPATEMPLPSLFLNTPAMDSAEYDGIVERACAALDVARSAATRAAMARMHSVFAPISSACETGFWLARSTTAIRMVFMKVQASPSEAIERLAAGGHRDPSILHRAPVPALWAASTSVAVAVDVGEDVAQGCHVEMYRPEPQQLLDHLVAARLCTPGKRARIAAWEGDVCCGNDASLDAEVWLQRRLHHVKLSVQPGRPLSAKAYLSMSGVAVREERAAHASA